LYANNLNNANSKPLKPPILHFVNSFKPTLHKRQF